MLTRFLLASIVSVIFSAITHKVIAIPDLYFILGTIDGLIVLAILGFIEVKL